MNEHQNFIITTKLSQPPIRENLVPRTELLTRLNEGISNKLTLVSAAAGYGKTSLVNSWLQTYHYPVSWLSLDHRDNNISRFLTYLKIAISSMEPDCSGGLMEVEGRAGKFSTDLMLENIVRILVSQDHFRIIVMDDYHLISNPAIHDAFLFLLKNLPLPKIANGKPVSGTHFVLISRTDPPFRLARWRLNGVLTEIRTDDLRFNLEESAQLLNHNLLLNLSLEDIAELKSRSEGWVAGLQLAAVSMQGKNAKYCHEFINQIKGRDRLVFDYLIEEVFLQQPPNIQDFLVKSSILNQMNADLCDAITQKQDSKTILEQLDRNNVFVVPLDHQREWYRYLHFFGDVLAEKFELLPTEESETLHLRAAEWFKENNNIEDTLRHLLLANKNDQAAQMLENISESLINNGKFLELRSLVELFSDESIKNQAWLSVLRGWVSYFFAPDEMETWLLHAERGVGSNEQDPRSKQILGHIAALRSVHRINLGYLDEALDIASNALSYLSENDSNVTGMLQTALGIIWMLKGKYQQSLDYYIKSKNNLQQAGNTCAAGRALHLAGRIEIPRGNLHHAYRLFKEGGSYGGVGLVSFEWNKLDEAFASAENYYTIVNRLGIAVEIINAVPLARMLLEMGDLEKAKYFYEKYAGFLGHYSLTPWLDSDLVGFQIEYLSTIGDFRAVDHIVTIRKMNTGKNFDPPRFSEHIAYALSYLRRGDLDQVIKIATELEKHADQRKLIGRQIMLLAMLACAYQLKNETETAQNRLTKALSLGADEGYIRTYVAYGEPIMEMLAQLSHQDHPFDNTYIQEIIAAFLNNPSGGALSSPIHPDYISTSPTQPGVLIEPLTPRELEILHLVAAEQNNQEIAESLNISINTVKTHISNIFMKLGASNRLQATNRSRQLDLI